MLLQVWDGTKISMYVIFRCDFSLTKKWLVENVDYILCRRIVAQRCSVMLPVIFYFTAVDSHVYITVLNFILGIQLLTAIYTFYYMISTGSHYVISDFLDFC